MLKKAIIFSIVTFVLVGIVATVIYFATRPKPITGVPDIMAGETYWLQDFQAGLFEYPNTDEHPYGMSSGVPISLLGSNPESYCKFDTGLRVFRIHFENTLLEKTADFVFVVTRIKIGGGGIDADITHIVNGKLATYHMYATKQEIIITSIVKHEVRIASNEYEPDKKIEVLKENSIILTFNRQIPEYKKEANNG